LGRRTHPGYSFAIASFVLGLHLAVMLPGLKLSVQGGRVRYSSPKNTNNLFYKTFGFFLRIPPAYNFIIKKFEQNQKKTFIIELE
jgi:hypothetical protein